MRFTKNCRGFAMKEIEDCRGVVCRVQRSSEVGHRQRYNILTSYWVSCTNCEIATPYSRCEEDVVHWWNRRDGK
jgi:hypothetical protein